MKAPKRITLLLLVALAATPLMACSSRGADAGPAEEGEKTAEPAEQQTEPEGGQSQIANPFVDCGSAYEASKLAGFSVTFPEAVPGYVDRHYQAVKDELAQCFYSDGDKRVLVRKAKGSDDVSGDYNEYKETKEVGVGDLKVTEKGDGTLVHVVTWKKDGFSYAIDADEGLEPEVAENIVSSTL